MEIKRKEILQYYWWSFSFLSPLSFPPPSGGGVKPHYVTPLSDLFTPRRKRNKMK